MEDHETAKTIIAEDVEVTGTIKCASNIQIDGKLNGDLNCVGNALIGNTATIKGNISVDCVTVLGQINGNITAKDKIDLKSSANITGDIRSRRLTIEDGVTFVGKSEVNPASPTSASRPFSAGELSSPAHDILSPDDLESTTQDADVAAIREEIRKNVKEEVKSKSGTFFGKR